MARESGDRYTHRRAEQQQDNFRASIPKGVNITRKLLHSLCPTSTTDNFGSPRAQ